MGRIKIDYGIDLGTTNSALAVLNNGEIDVKNIDRANIVPSCVAYNRKGNVRVGNTALGLEPNFLEFKREMGTDWSTRKHPDIDEQVNAEELSAELLKKLKGEITEEQFKSVVITVPAMFDMNQVAATKRAGELAGFEQVEILMEPVAAAFVYGFKHKIKNGKFVVFDFGGGTFDAALVKAEGGVMTVESSEGDNHLGGKDLDNVVVENVLLPLIKEKYDIENLDKNAISLLKKKLKKMADVLKIDLGKNETFEVLTDVGQLGNDATGKEIEIDKTFTVDEIHGAMTDIFMKAIGHAKKLLKANNFSVSDLTTFVLVGGPTKIPLFRELIEKEITKPDFSLNPMTAIAEGAALYAATFNNESDGHGALVGGSPDDPIDRPAAVELEIEYAATSVQDEEAIGIKRKNSSEDYSAIVSRSDGWQSSRHELDDVIMVGITEGKPNSFSIELLDASNNPVLCTPNQFTIIPGTSVDGGAPLPYNIGMEIFDERKGNVFTPFKGLEKDKKMPLVGVTDRELYNSSALRPGMKEDKMTIPIYFARGEARDSRSIINIFGDTIEVNGMDVEKLVPEDSLVEFTMKIDISQNMTLEIEFPHLDMDVIAKTMAFPATATVKNEQIDTLFNEIKKGITKLSKSTETVPNMDDFKSKQSYYTNEYQKITDGSFGGIFGELRSFLLEIDIALDNMQWPMLKKEVIDTLFEFEELVNECVDKKLAGWEKDKSDLEHFKKHKEQLFAMSKPDQNAAEELISNMKSANIGIVARHQGKEMFTALIQDFDRSFASIDWKSASVARQEIDRGLQLINNGADQNELGAAAQAIIGQMQNPDVGPSGGGVKT